MTHLKILSKEEEEAFRSPPEFYSEARKQFFAMTNWLRGQIKTLVSPTNKVFFILLYGYFKASYKIYHPKRFSQKDIDYVAFKLDIPLEEIDLSSYKKQTMNRHKNIILEHLGFRVFPHESQTYLQKEAESLVEKQLRPKIIFHELIDYLVKERMEVPSYLWLARTITSAINNFEKKLSNIVENKLTDTHKIILDKLTQSNEKSRYILTPLKKINQSLKPQKISAAVEDLKYLYELYNHLSDLICPLGLSTEIINYYARTVIRSDIYDLVRKSSDKKYLYLCCFVVHQLYKQHDALVDILLKAVQSNTNICEKEYKLQTFEESKERAKETKQLIHSYSSQNKVLAKIKSIAYSDELSNPQKVSKIQTLIANEDAQEEELLELVKHQVDRTLFGDLYYEIMINNSRKLQNRVSKLIKSLVFNEETTNKELLIAILFFKNSNGNLGNNAPIEFLEERERKIVFERGEKLKISLYKSLLFINIAKAIKSGELNLKYSNKYRAFDEYLINKERWLKNRDSYLIKAGLDKFQDIEKVIAELGNHLDQAYHKTNKGILSKSNKHAYFDDKDVLHINTPRVVKEKTENISQLFPDNRYIPLSEILSTVNKYSNFTSAFSQWQGKYVKNKPKEKTLFAGIIAYGCNLGVRKISKISKNINEYELDNTINWYFTLDNVIEINDKILSFEKKLALSYFLRGRDKITHTSSDGQKYNVRRPNLNANYSFKYGGNKMASSAFEFIDNRHFLFYSTVISSAEREATYVIDGLLHNNVVKSDLHSTDTHGYSEIIFGTTHILDFSYAPRIKNFKKQTIYSFRKKREYKDLGFKILPDRYVNTELIKKHWDDILRFICTLKFREVSASQLFKRLSSFSKNHPLYSAIKAFGQIIKSIFILKYIDKVKLRQSITKQLNIGENSNKFSKVVFYGNNQDFMYETKEEQEIAESCKRLIKNAIITWNYLYLSQLLVDCKSDQQKLRILKIIQNGSIETWEHINLHGEFDFNEEKMRDSVNFKLPKILSLKLVENWEVDLVA